MHTNTQRHELLECGEVSANSVFVVNFNPDGIILNNVSYYRDYYDELVTFKTFNEADEYLRGRIQDWSVAVENRTRVKHKFDPNKTICTITQYVLGEPESVLEKFIAANGGKLRIIYGPDGDIVRYNIWNIDWTPKNLMKYNNKFKCGDIVDCFMDNSYVGRFVVTSEVESILPYIKECRHDFMFKQGYTLHGCLSHMIYKDEPDEDMMVLTDVYNMDLRKVENGCIFAEFYNAISAQSKCVNIYDIDTNITYYDLYDMYFWQDDKQAFYEAMESVNDKILDYAKQMNSLSDKLKELFSSTEDMDPREYDRLATECAVLASKNLVKHDGNCNRNSVSIIEEKGFHVLPYGKDTENKPGLIYDDDGHKLYYSKLMKINRSGEIKKEED